MSCGSARGARNAGIGSTRSLAGKENVIEALQSFEALLDLPSAEAGGGSSGFSQQGDSRAGLLPMSLESFATVAVSIDDNRSLDDK